MSCQSLHVRLRVEITSEHVTSFGVCKRTPRDMHSDKDCRWCSAEWRCWIVCKRRIQHDAPARVDAKSSSFTLLASEQGGLQEEGQSLLRLSMQSAQKLNLLVR